MPGCSSECGRSWSNRTLPFGKGLHRGMVKSEGIGRLGGGTKEFLKGKIDHPTVPSRRVDQPRLLDTPGKSYSHVYPWQTAFHATVSSLTYTSMQRG